MMAGFFKLVLVSVFVVEAAGEMMGHFDAKYYKFGNHLYAFSTSAMGRQQCVHADTACSGLGDGRLVTINSQGENDFLYQVIQMEGWTEKHFWIGFHKGMGEAAFTWRAFASGLDFEHWREDFPQMTTATNDECLCAAMSGEDGKWVDQGCESMHYYICEQDNFLTYNEHVYKVVDGFPNSSANALGHGGPMDMSTIQYDCADVKSFCEKRGGGHLAVLREEGAMSLVKNHMRETMYNNQQFYIGLMRNGSNAFMWADGNMLQGGSWKTGEPFSNTSCDCTVMSAADPFEWMSTQCDGGAYHNAFVCEFPLGMMTMGESGTMTTHGSMNTHQTGSSMTSQYDAEYFLHMDSLYTFVIDEFDRLSCMDAAKMCVNHHNGHLVKVDSQQEHDFLVHTLLQNGWSGKAFWIGLTWDPVSSTYLWMKDDSGSTLNMWMDGYPMTEASVEFGCVGIGGSGDLQEGGNGWKWRNYGPQQKFNYICETRHEDFAAYHHYLYKIHDGARDTALSKYMQTHGTSMSCDDAQNFCMTEGHGKLVTMRTEDDWYAVTQVFSLFNHTNDMFFIGLKKNSMDGSFAWMDGTALEYSKWASGHPVVDEECSCTMMSKSTYEWTSSPCGTAHSNFGIICQNNLRDSMPEIPYVPWHLEDHELPVCGMPFQPRVHTNSGYHYYFSTEMATCLEADEMCRNMGYGRLASVTSAGEMDFIEATMADRYTADRWLGIYAWGSSSTEELQYRWLDGRHKMYTKWDTNHPASSPVDSSCYCAQIAHGEEMQTPEFWRTLDCSMKATFICKADVDECCNSPCQNDGTCVNTDGGHVCQCGLGFGGINCEETIDYYEWEADNDCSGMDTAYGSCSSFGGLQGLVWGDTHFIADDDITASSEADGEYMAKEYVRFQGDCPDGVVCGWAPGGLGGDYTNEYITFDLIFKFFIEHVATQGRSDKWVTEMPTGRYALSFSMDGMNFTHEMNNGGAGYITNLGPDVIVTNNLAMSVLARYVRVHIIDFQPGLAIRIEIYGCEPLNCYDDYAGYDRYGSSTTDMSSTDYYPYDYDLLRSASPRAMGSAGVYLLSLVVGMTCVLF